MNNIKTVVIGAGPSGLGVAYASNSDYILLEREKFVGGLCRSYRIDDVVLDVGGHSFHTPHPEVYDLIHNELDLQLFGQTRKAKVLYGRQLIDYPFQRNYEQIEDLEVVRECTGQSESKKDLAAVNDFEEWIYARFGNGVAKHFMLPYNRKLWARDLKRIGTDWVAERVAAPKGETEKFLNIGGARKPLYQDTTVYYPGSGGFSAIYDALVKKIRIAPITEANVNKIDLQRRLLWYGDQSKSVEWSVLINTMPITTLLDICEGCPQELRRMARELEAMSLYVLYYVVDEPISTDVQRIYCGESDVFPHKIALNHNSSDYLRGTARHGVMAEVSYSGLKPVNPDEALRDTAKLLVDLSIVSAERKISKHWWERVEHAYPVYTHQRQSVINEIRSWLEHHGIFSIGRFGAWEYKNSDACLYEGMALAKSIGL